MAQLNDLIVTGSSRFLNKIQGTASNADALTTPVGGGTSPVYIGSAGTPVAINLAAASVGSAGTASYIKTPSAAGYVTDQFGNLKHQGVTATENFQLRNNANTPVAKYYWETGNFETTGNITAANFIGTASYASTAKRRIFIQGTQTTATTTGLWTGDASEYFQSAADLTDGQEITYWVPLPTTGNVTLNLKFGDGTSSGAVNCYYGGTSRLTTHYGQGQAVHLTYRKDVKIPSTGSTTYTGWWADANYDSNSNTIDVLQGTYTIPVAGATAGLKQYSLFAEDANGKYSSFTTQNGTAVTKTVNRTDYFDISKIYYCSTGGNYATNANIGTSIVRWAQPLVDLRYTLNIATNALTARKPLYLVFNKTATTSNAIGDTLYKLAGTGTTDWWTQTLPTSADGKIYAEISKAVYDGYRGDLSVTHKYYEYTDKLHDYDSISALKNADIEVNFFVQSGVITCDVDFDTLLAASNGYSDKIKSTFSNYDGTNGIYNCISTKNIDYGETDGGDGNFVFYFDNITLNYTSTGISIINGANFPHCFAHAEGVTTTAYGIASHAEGGATTASELYTHAEGTSAVASSTAAHAEGYITKASEIYSHAEGYATSAASTAAHAEGVSTKVTGQFSHAEGNGCSVSGISAHAEGSGTTVSGMSSHAEGHNCIATASWCHAEGEGSKACGTRSHAEGFQTCAAGMQSHSEGYQTTAKTDSAHSEGYLAIAISDSTHAEGYKTTASGNYSHTEGYMAVTTAQGAHAEGYRTTATVQYAHAEGDRTSASSTAAHAEGYNTKASGKYSHAEGYSTTASAIGAHAEGSTTSASSSYAHTEGGFTTASAYYTHAEGYYTIANKNYQTAIGLYNTTVDDALFIVGNGTTDNARGNAMYVTTAGEIYTSWLNGAVRSTPLSDGKFNRLVMPPYTTGSQLYPLQVEYGRTLSDSGIGTFGVLTNYNTYAVDLNIALTQQNSPYVFNATISYPTTMYSAPSFIFLIPRDKNTGVNSRVCYNNGFGIDRQPTNFPASAWAGGKTSGVHQFMTIAGSAGTAYVTVIMGWR